MTSIKHLKKTDSENERSAKAMTSSSVTTSSGGSSTVGQMRKRLRSISISHPEKDCSPEKKKRPSTPSTASIIRSMRDLVRERRTHGQHQLVGSSLVLAEPSQAQLSRFFF